MTTVTVTAEHIREGFAGNCYRCPIALALEATFPQAGNVAVSELYATVYQGGWNVMISLPEEAARFIGAFDMGDPVEPFSFTVDYPEASS